jgi:hypothetical protein
MSSSSPGRSRQTSVPKPLTIAVKPRNMARLSSRNDTRSGLRNMASPAMMPITANVVGMDGRGTGGATGGV